MEARGTGGSSLWGLWANMCLGRPQIEVRLTAPKEDMGNKERSKRLRCVRTVLFGFREGSCLILESATWRLRVFPLVVVWCGVLLLLSGVFLFEGDFSCRPCEPQRFLFQLKKPTCHASGTRNLLNTVCSEKGMMQQRRSLASLGDGIIQGTSAIWGARFFGLSPGVDRGAWYRLMRA